jgi:hypothetical protein
MTRAPLDHLPDDEIERLYRAGSISDSEIERIALARLSPQELAIIDAFAYGLAKLLHTPIDQLAAEADAHRRGWSAGPIVGSKAGAWANQALDYALNTDASHVATAYMKPPPGHIYDQRSRWVVYVMPSRRDLDDWYQSVVATPSIYHYVAAFDKTAPEWGAGRAVATTAEPSAYTSGDIGVFRAGSCQKLDRGAPASRSSAKIQRSKEHDMSAYGDYVGADGQSYPEVASRAVTSVYHQNPSPVYGYFRAGTQQKIYLYQSLEDAHGWFAALAHGQAQPYDYVAVFAATDLTRPVPGLESFGHTVVSGNPEVGSWLPFMLGLPAGALGGYFLRKWQEGHPGQAVPGIPPGKLPAPRFPGAPPKTSGDWIGGPWLDVEEPAYAIGGPWVDIEEPAYTIGGPWVDVVGAQVDDRDRARSWPQTKALIQSAINEVGEAASMAPAAAYVWSLDPPGPALSHLEGAYYAADPSRRVELEGTTGILPFASPAEALDYMRQRIHTPHVALALFDRRSPHWPNPTNWTKSNDPAYAPVIEAQAAKATPARMAGSYVGAVPWQTTIGTAIDDVRTRAQSIANKRAGSVVGVIHTAKDGLWHALAFRNADDADDWLGTATQEPTSYTYAAYYDKEDFQWPHPVNEKIGGPRVATKPGSPGTRGPATTSSGIIHGGRSRSGRRSSWWAA